MRNNNKKIQESQSNEYDRASLRASNLDENNKNFLESIRFRDSDNSFKAGAILNTSALLITTSFVYLTASDASPFQVPAPTIVVISTMLGLGCLTITAATAVHVLTAWREYSEKQETALKEYYHHVNRLSQLVQTARLFLYGGACFIIVAVIYSLLANGLSDIETLIPY